MWIDAVYESDVRPLELLVACVYYDHAQDKDHAWVTLDRLVERSHLSRSAAHRHRVALVAEGWLEPISEPNRRRATRYRLTIPSSHSLQPLSSSAEQPLSSSAPSASSSAPSPEQFTRDNRPQVLPQNKPHSGPSPMRDRAEPTDEALALFNQSHPGREREALTAALADYHRRKGEPCTNPTAYFGTWTTTDLTRRITLGKAEPKCPDCHGEGWDYSKPTGPTTFAKCTHPRKATT